MGSGDTGMFDCFDNDGTERQLAGSTCGRGLQETKRGKGFSPNTHIHACKHTHTHTNFYSNTASRFTLCWKTHTVILIILVQCCRWNQPSTKLSWWSIEVDPYYMTREMEARNKNKWQRGKKELAAIACI